MSSRGNRGGYTAVQSRILRECSSQRRRKEKENWRHLKRAFFFLSLCAVHQEKSRGVRVKRVLIIDRTWELRKLWEKRSKVEWDSALLFCFCGRHRENSARRKASVSSLNQGVFPSLLFFLPLSSLFFSFSLSSVSSTMVHLAPSIQWLRSLRFHKERFFFFFAIEHWGRCARVAAPALVSCRFLYKSIVHIS